MSGYSDMFSDWRKKAKDKAKELDEKYNLSEKVGQTVKAAEDVLRKGEEVARETVETVVEKAAPVVSSTVETARDEFKKVDEQHNITDNLKRAAEQTAKAGADTIRAGAEKAAEKAGGVAEKAGDVAEMAGEAARKAAKVYGTARETAREYYSRAEDAYDFGSRAARASWSVMDGLKQTKQWVEENPGKAALVGLAAVVGIRLGSAFPGLDKSIFGVSRHWLFHSGLAAVGVTKLSETFFDYLKEQEALIAEGKLTEAEAERVRFERKLAKYVGAPLLGAFNVALGTTLLAEMFTPGKIVGFPISIILGGNPVLETMWLFGNGLVCIYNGYELVMYALEDQEEIRRVIREIKALLPPASPEAA